MADSVSCPVIVFRPATPYEFASVTRLYDEGGYNGRYQASDLILLALVGSETVGVVRLVDEQGVKLLRGLYIARDWRGQGLGRRLLHAAMHYLDQSCFCLTYAEMLDFYGHEGFYLCDDADVPAFLLERRQQYSWTGKNYRILLRPLS